MHKECKLMIPNHRYNSLETKTPIHGNVLHFSSDYNQYRKVSSARN